MIEHRRHPAFFRVGIAAILAIVATCQSLQADSFRTETELGRALFADRNLSFSRKQNCVSCHSPELAFTDPRVLGDIQGAVSRGGDGHSLGDRNSPTLTYALMTPALHISSSHEPIGGMFWDGRAKTIEEQVRDPILNPLEMGMPDEDTVVSRLRANADYREAFTAIFGSDVLADTPKAFSAMEHALAAYLRSSDFASFDSKYDRSLRGEVALSSIESKGRDLFFSNDRSGCSACHSSTPVSGAPNDAFTNFRYYNLGVPKNLTVRRANGGGVLRIDHGLLQNPATIDPAFDGKFKVPTLRNVAVTGPYMHNGVFQDLRTAVLFHQRFSKTSIAETNPETGAKWDSAEVGANIDIAKLEAQSLTAEDVDAIIAFLKTLTDQRYEVLSGN
ncbi:MAG: c-type cytochrome [Proteobacteria bacterium]|nr:c-type cytochrome [Pseudomonadota bacterium]